MHLFIVVHAVHMYGACTLVTICNDSFLCKFNPIHLDIYTKKKTLLSMEKI